MKPRSCLGVALLALMVATAPAQLTAPGLENFDAATAATSFTCSNASFGTYPTGWVSNAAATNSWRVHSGSTSSFATGPTGDHTSGSGFYLYTETSCGTGSWIAEIDSPEFDANAVAMPTVEFWFHLYGISMGTLELQEFDGTSYNTIWTMSGDQGDVWQFAQVSITPYAHPSGAAVKFRFKGTRGTSFESDMSIDDVKFGEPTPFDFQTNSLACTANIDGVSGSPLAPVIITKTALPSCPVPVDATGVVNISSDVPMSQWELAISSLPATAPSPSGSGLALANGQKVNLNVFNTITFLNGGGLPGFEAWPLAPFPGAQGGSTSWGFGIGTALNLTIQAIVIDPASASGLTLSQATEMQITTATGPCP